MQVMIYYIKILSNRAELVAGESSIQTPLTKNLILQAHNGRIHKHESVA